VKLDGLAALEVFPGYAGKLLIIIGVK